MGQNEMGAKAGLPVTVRLSEGLGGSELTLPPCPDEPKRYWVYPATATT